MLLLVLQRRQITAQDLAQHFEVSERTIYRDMKALQQSGLPLVGTAGEGYQLLDTFRLPPVMLNADEAIAFSIAAHLLLAYAKGDIAHHIEAARTKIESVLPDRLRQQVENIVQHIQFYPSSASFHWDEPYLLPLLSAIDKQQQIRITYRAYQQQVLTERLIEPYQLTFATGRWYLSAYCHLRRDMRDFRLNRIMECHIIGEHFERIMMIPAPKQMIEIQVRFSERVQPYVIEQQHYGFHSQDGALMTYQVDTLAEIRQWILSYGADAEVLSPLELRHWIQEEAQRLINLLT